MDSARNLPILKTVDVVILGGSLAAVEKALACAAQGNTTAMILQESFLGTDRCMTLDYPEGTTPDNYKKELEHRCADSGVELIYMSWLLDIQPGEGRTCLRIGGKFGIAGVLAGEVLDYRTDWQDASYRAWLTRRGAPEEARILEVKNPVAGETSTASRLLRGRMELLKAYEAQKQDYRLGRFAIRGTGTMALPVDDPVGKTAHSVISHICPLRGTCYDSVAADPTFCGEESHWDLVVVGGGTAGAMAALTAARKGLKVVLAEPNYALGGTSTIGGVSAYWFGTRYSDTEEVDSLVASFTAEAEQAGLPGLWGPVDQWNPDVKATVLMKLLLEAGVELLLGHCAFGVWKENEKIAGVAVSGENGIRFLAAPFVFDATGDGDVAVFAGAESEYGNSLDCVTYWASLAQYKTADTYQNNFSAMMRLDDPLDYTRFVVNARKFGSNLFDHGSYGCCRESRHIRGKTQVTLRDLMMHAHHPDTLYTCYSNYDPKGKVTADIVYCGVLPQQTVIEIPLSALIPVDGEGKTLEGIYVLGKAISASHDVFPSIRMQKDLMHQGAVMGNLIADCKKLGTKPEDLPRERLRAYSNDPLRAELAGKLSLEDCVRSLTVNSRSHWVDADFTDCETHFQPLVALMYGEPQQVIPLLEQRLEEERDEEMRLILIRIQLWHGCDRHVEEFLDSIEKRLTGSTLPKRLAATTCAQLLPDHGVMPEVVYDMNLLAYSGNPRCAEPFERVYDLLVSSHRYYQDVAQGIFTYIESFAFAAERNGNHKILDLMEKLIGLHELAHADEMDPSDLMKERFQLLRYLLLRALASGGRQSGHLGLAAQLNQPSLTLALSARKTLERLWGEDHGRDDNAWQVRIHSAGEQLPQSRILHKTF